MNPLRHLLRLLVISSLAVFACSAKAATVTGAGYTNGFAAQPPAADWATLSVSGSGNDSYDMDTDSNTRFTAAGVTAQTTSSSGSPPAQLATATWSSNAFFLQTRPTGNRNTALIGKFVNDTGTNATQVTVSYVLTIVGTASTEDSGKGTRVYYSLTGATGSWVNLPAFNNTSSTAGSTTLATNLPINWTNGGSLYLLWVDDNNNGGTDVANQIDNFSLRVTAGLPLAFSCTLTAPTNNALFPAGTSIAATAAAAAGSEPYRVEYFTNSGAGNTGFASAGSSSTVPYGVSLGNLPAGTYNIYAVATDDAGVPATATTATNTFLVADPLVCTLTAPINEATFDSSANVTGTATVAGGTAPYSVQFFLDNATAGIPATNAPFESNIGMLFVGDHTIKAIVQDAKGWSSTSTVATVHITGPLAIILTPTNETSYNYGRPLVLNVSLGGGSGPYTATFYTNGQPAGTVGTAPFELNLGILPVGSYNCRVHAVDSSTTPQQVDSSTNVISIVANPLTATLTAPTAGQQVASNLAFSVAATATVGSPVTVAGVEFFFDGISLGTAPSSPYSIAVTNRALGSHTVYAVATDSLGWQSFTATNQMSFIVDPLANNNFVNRIPLTLPARTTGSNIGATTEGGEPTGSGFTRWGSTLWWTWTAPTNGPVQIDTYGSSFNTLLAVYTGSAVNGLTQVAMNDNAPGVSSGPSLVNFTAVPGTEYQIVVGGIQGFGPGGGTIATGSIQLALSMPPTVTLTAPTNNAFFMSGSDIPLSATATAPIGTLGKVEFFRAGTNIATLREAPYTFVYAGAPLGSNTFFAVATDSLGQTATSAVARVLVADLGVTLTSPADGATYTSTGSITVSAFPLLNSGSMTGIEFFADDTRFGVDTNSPYSATWTNVTAGVHQLTAVGTDYAGLQYTSAPVLIAVARTLMPTGSVWKYHDAGVDLGTAWVAPEFDDSGWTNGPSELGYGDGDEATVINSGPADNFYLTAYFRRSIMLTNAAAYAEYILSVKRDDGAVVYVNGKEVARFNMNSGTVTFSTLAPNASDDGANFFTASVAPTNFVEGANVIAVEVHQSGPTSSDLSFNLALLGMPIIPRNALPLAALTSPINHRTELAPASLTLTAEASDKDGFVTNMEFYANGVKLGETTNLPASLVWSNVPAGVYQLLAVAVDDLGGRGASPVVTVSVHDLGAPSWTAYNDHAAGQGTHANTTLYDAFGRNGAALRGPLRNVATGAWLPVQLSLATSLALPGSQSAAPIAGTPVHTIFNGFVDFGATFGQPAIQILGDGYVTHTFSGLNPQRRYQLRASVIGGSATAYNSWTRFALLNAAALVPAHTTNVIAGQGQLGGLGLNEAAMNTGNNRTGDVVSWDMIVPNADGTLVLKSSRYLGPAPGNNQPAQVALAPVAIRLEEVGPVPITWISLPGEGFTVEGPTNVTITAAAYGYDGIAQVEFFGNGVSLGSVAASPYSLIWSNGRFGANTLTAVAFGTSGGRATSAPVNFTITIPPTNVVAPYILSQTPSADATVTNYLTNIVVRFSERVIGVDAADLLINGAPARAVSGSGSNYTFTLAQPPYGPINIRWAENHGITDIGWPANLPFSYVDESAIWNYQLVDRLAPTVTAKVPAAGATVTNLQQISVTFSEAVANVNASDLLVNGIPAYDLSGSGSNYLFEVSQPASGTVNITWAVNHGITDLAAAPNAFNRTGSGATWSYTLDSKSVLIESNSVWLYLKGTNEASIPTNAWRQLVYDDSAWPTGPAPFVFGETTFTNATIPGTDVGDMAENAYSSIYLRKSFVIAHTASITNLVLNHRSDDGFIAWINGVEVYRYNMPTGEVAFNGSATTTATESGFNSGVPFIQVTLTNGPAALVTGTNILAIHAFNMVTNPASSDFVFNAQLYTYLPNTEVVAPRIVSLAPAAGYVYALTNLVLTFSEPVEHADSADLLINGVPATSVSSVSNRVYTFAFTQPPIGAVTVALATNHGIADLDLDSKPLIGADAGWNYILLNADAPYITTAAPGPSATVTQMTQVVITFSEAVTGLEAADLLVNGVPAAGLSSAGLTHTFTFAQPAYGTVSFGWATNHGIKDLATPANDFDPLWPNHVWSVSLVDQIPPVLVSINPPAGTLVNNLTQLTVSFSEAVTGVNAADLLLNGKAATAVSGSNGTYTFSFGQPNAANIQVAWTANHGIRDLATTPNAFDATAPGATWSYPTMDNVPPTLAAVSPAPGGMVGSLSQLTLTFDEPVAGVSAGSLTVNGLAALQVSGAGAGPYVFGFDQPTTGLVQVAVSGALQDLAVPPNQFAGSNWTYILDTNIPPPSVTRGPYLQIQTTTGIEVRWRTSTNTNSRVYYGLAPQSLTNFLDDLTQTAEHSVTLTNLMPDTKYYYGVGATGTQPLTSTNFYFSTAPPVGTVRPIRIWYVSDFGFGNADERSVRDSYYTYVASQKPADVWITGGDNDQLTGSDANYTTTIFGANFGYANMLQNQAVWPTIGNHDYSTGQGVNYYANFSLPTKGEAGGVPSGTEHYYSFNYGNIHFVTFDGIDGTYSRTTNTTMIQWLREDLAANTQPWVIAYWHGPPYTKGSHDSDSTSDTLAWMTQMRENVVPVLESYGVDLVLCGHSHVHERTWLINGHYGYSSTFSETNKIDGGDGRLTGTGAYRQTVNGVGTVYVSNGMGGQPRNTSSSQHAAHLVKITGILGSLVIDVNGSQLDCKFMNASGGTEDNFTLVKNANGAPQLVISRANGMITLAWPVAATNYNLISVGTLGHAGSVTVGGWQAITNGIQTNDSLYQFQFNAATNPPAGFFQLKQR